MIHIHIDAFLNFDASVGELLSLRVSMGRRFVGVLLKRRPKIMPRDVLLAKSGALQARAPRSLEAIDVRVPLWILGIGENPRTADAKIHLFFMLLRQHLADDLIDRDRAASSFLIETLSHDQEAFFKTDPIPGECHDLRSPEAVKERQGEERP